ncbi:MAG: DUF4097 family beta strand repeat-containing protein [Acidobacteria bacterium]|nr:DUF4097 family beta strand repeat-containing protein [Acidobacteriota bacterium]
MTAWQDAGTGARLRGGEMHAAPCFPSLAKDGKIDGQPTGLIVPRESNLPGAVKYRLLSQARRRAQETARRALVAVVTGAVLAASPATLAARTIDGQFERTLSIGSDTLTLDIRTGSGRIAVTVGEPGVARVVGNIRGYADRWTPVGPDDVAKSVRTLAADPPISLDGNVLRVGHLDRLQHRQVGISYELVVPADTRVLVWAGSGDVSVAGVTGAVEATTGAGSIDLTTVGVAADVQTGAGPVGIAGLGTALRARTGSGWIRVAGAPGGAWDLSTGSGGIRIDLPEDAAFEVDARTRSGDVRTEHPVVARDEMRRGWLQGTVRGGGPMVTLRAGSGSIAIR